MKMKRGCLQIREFVFKGDLIVDSEPSTGISPRALLAPLHRIWNGVPFFVDTYKIADGPQLSVRLTVSNLINICPAVFEFKYAHGPLLFLGSELAILAVTSNNQLIVMSRRCGL